jgi:hypothetical protein
MNRKELFDGDQRRLKNGRAELSEGGRGAADTKAKKGKKSKKLKT